MATRRLSTDIVVPFVDLEGVNSRVKDAILADMGELVDNGTFTNGPSVAKFEVAFADYCGTSECAGTASGLDALRLGLLAAGIAPSDEVIVPANTFIATFEAVSQAGGIPVPVDVSMIDYNLDPTAAEAAITRRTRFLMPVHLYGQMADMRAVNALAERHGLVVIEDACQAHGAERDGLRAGAAGCAGAFSFYPAKNLGAFGDAGALVTSDTSLADTVRAMREHGQRAKYVHDVQGYTARLDAIQAVVLLHKLAGLEQCNHERRLAAAFYANDLGGVGDLVMPAVAPGSLPVWHVFAVHTEHRDQLARYLLDNGVATGVHYPCPPHLSPAYSTASAAGLCPVTESLCNTLLSLPIYPGITDSQLQTVTSTIRAFFHG